MQAFNWKEESIKTRIETRCRRPQMLFAVIEKKNPLKQGLKPKVSQII